MIKTVRLSNPAKAVLVGVVGAAALSLAAAPNSAASDQILPRAGDDGPADVAIQQLQTAGYSVSVNWLQGHPNVPLSECKVTGISGLQGSVPTGFDTVYVDVSCPNAK